MDCDKYYTIDIDKTIDFINKKTRTIKKKIYGKDLTVTVKIRCLKKLKNL